MTLSDKIKRPPYSRNCIEAEDVKEFIIKETLLIVDLYSGKITWKEFIESRNKLLGKELVE